MRNIFQICLVVISLLTTACSIKQEVHPVGEPIGMDEICIIEDPAVREGFLPTYVAALCDKGYRVKVLQKSSPELEKCNFTSTYLGLWSWDLALYLSYARIDVMHNNRTIGTASYDSRHGSANMGKFVKGDKKIRELVDKMFPSSVNSPEVPTAQEAAKSN